MANVMNMKDLKQKVSRNGFDISQRVAFSAKVGEILPIGVYEVIPGDTFKANLKSFTRTVPLNSAAYCRITEYYDFFFVPTRLLWRGFNNFVLQSDDNTSVAFDENTPITITENQPYFTRDSIARYLTSLYDGNLNNQFNFPRWQLSVKILQYLGYGDFIDYSDLGDLKPYPNFQDDNLKLNPFPLLAYQKIYQDFFRNQQWEHSAPYTCNVDYLDYQSMEIDPARLNNTHPTMFDMNYCNYPLDYFFGLLPNSQFGSVAELSLIADEFEAQNFVPKFGPITTVSSFNAKFSIPKSSMSQLQAEGYSTNEIKTYIDAKDLEKIFSSSVKSLSALAVRQLEFLQKYKEILQTGGRDYRDLVEKLYGVTLPEAMSNTCQYLGGYKSFIDVNEVINQNITGDNSADIAGKGTAYAGGDFEKTFNEHGIIMVMYHAVPQLDFSTSFISKLCMKTRYTDYAMPSFDKLGMQQVSIYELSADPDVLHKVGSSYKSKFLGYAPQYVEYKTNFDKALGAFRSSLNYWIIPFSDDFLLSMLGYAVPDGEFVKDYKFPSVLNYTLLKANPLLTKNLFSTPIDSSVDTDTMLVQTNQEVYVVRNLDYNGLPY